MSTKTTLPISEARRKIFEITDKVQKPSTFYTLTERGKPKAVIMSAEEFESWQETMEVAKDFPNLDKEIRRVEKDIKSGEYKKYPTLEEVMEEYGFVLADKKKSKYEISNKNRTKSKKRIKKNS